MPLDRRESLPGKATNQEKPGDLPRSFLIPSFGLKAKEIEHLWVFHTLILFSDGFE